MKDLRRRFLATIITLVLLCASLTGCESAQDAFESVINEALEENIKEDKQKDTQEDTQEDIQEDSSQFQKAQLDRVVDGDTIIVKIDGERKRVRLIGINTAESAIPEDMIESVGKENTKEGELASEFVKDLLKDTEYVWLDKDVSDTDKYDRLLRYVWLEEPTDAWDPDEVAEKMLNGIIIKNGYSKAIAYKPDTAYHKIFEKIR